MFNTPYVDPQMQLNQLAARYPQYFNQQNYSVPQQPYVNNGRVVFVTNIEEAKATPADMLGNPIFFYNKAKNEIYIKQTDATGAAPIREYEQKKEETTTVAEPSAIEIKLQDIENRLDEISAKLEKPVKKGSKDATEL